MPKLARQVITLDSIQAAKRTAAVTGRMVRLWDAKVTGFGAKVRPPTASSEGGTGGNVSWIFRYPHPETVGVWREVTLPLSRNASPAEARARAVAVRADVSLGLDPLNESQQRRLGITVADAWEEWLNSLATRKRPARDATLKEYRRAWQRDVIGPDAPDFARAFARLRVADVTPEHVGAIFDHIGLRAPIMANRFAGRMSTFFRWCERLPRRYREPHSNPVLVERHAERASNRILSDEEITALGDALRRAETEGLPVPARLRQAKKPATKRGPYRVTAAPRCEPANPVAVEAIRLLLLTGWRRNEVLTLKYADVDFVNRRVLLRETKTGDSRRTLSREAVALIQRQQPPAADPTNPYVFPGARAGQPLSTVRRVWYAVREAAGLDGQDVERVRLHDLRHHHASALIRQGATPLQVKDALGHRSVASTARYSHLWDADTKKLQDKAAKGLAAALNPEPAPSRPRRRSGGKGAGAA